MVDLLSNAQLLNFWGCFEPRRGQIFLKKNMKADPGLLLRALRYFCVFINLKQECNNVSAEKKECHVGECIE